MDKRIDTFLQRHQLSDDVHQELDTLIHALAIEKAWAMLQVPQDANADAAHADGPDEATLDGPSTANIQSFDATKTLTDPKAGEELRDELERRLRQDAALHTESVDESTDPNIRKLGGSESSIRPELTPTQESLSRFQHIQDELAAWEQQPLPKRQPPPPTTSPQLAPVTTPPGSRPLRVRSPEERYEDLGLIGVGGMGEVRRVRDRQLKRVVAMKVIRKELIEEFSLSIRFIEEAQATAQLQHPGIIPLHDIGQLADGRYFFTMKEIKGKTLEEVIQALHDVSTPAGQWSRTEDGWTIRRVLDAFRRVCEAVGYAHSRGALHRDIKPENVMLGAHGEVLVLDWGLVKIKGHTEKHKDWRTTTQEIVVTDRSQKDEYVTMVGAITGTPTYMSPEQAKGRDDIDARSDVYALGAVLYEVMSGRPPYQGDDHEAVVVQLLKGPPPPLVAQEDSDIDSTWARAHQHGPPQLPLAQDLVHICQRAMARNPSHRYENATALAQAVAQWLEGDQKREKALEMVAEANAKLAEVDILYEQVQQLQQRANAMLGSVEPWDLEDEKRMGWSIQDEARRLEREAVLKALESELSLQGALAHYPLLIEARVALAESYKRLHHDAERAKNEKDKLRAEQMLFSHVQAIPPTHPSFQHHLAYLKGDGAITLLTNPPGAEVILFRYVEQHRRLLPIRGRSLGKTPLIELSLPMGSYLLLLQKDGYADVRYPIEISRQELWDGVPPGERTPQPILLPKVSEIGDYECYVPPGWFWSGGDPDAANGLPRRRLWVDGFSLRYFPITHKEYMIFLNALIREGREAEALRYVPMLPGLNNAEPSCFYGRDNKSMFVPRPLSPRELRQQPVTHITLNGARAFAQWTTVRSGQMWCLPDEFEWEKAARGVDGRLFPWGNALDPSWCCMKDSRSSGPRLDVIDSWPIDESPYGVRGMAGNVKDWCANPYRVDGPRQAEISVRTLSQTQTGTLKGLDKPSLDQFDNTTPAHTLRGGSWSEGALRCHSASRRGGLPEQHYDNVSFRIIRYL